MTGVCPAGVCVCVCECVWGCGRITAERAYVCARWHTCAGHAQSPKRKDNPPDTSRVHKHHDGNNTGTLIFLRFGHYWLSALGLCRVAVID